jgi:eukaryotic-like serine/threonine-protein kinase
MSSAIPPAPKPIVIDPHVAHKLAGMSLPCGWVLTEKLRKLPVGPDETGGNFSVGYIASKGGRTAFVKVFDLGGALWRNSNNIMKAMMMLGQDHQYECQLLDICRAAQLDRIVQVISQGQADIEVGNGLATPIPYIVFEYAEKDIRKALLKTNAIEDAWRLRMLQQVAVGLQQLHGKNIAHQDLKPSNVLIFEQDDVGAKIADLGRASRNDGTQAGHDGENIAGDPSYAPPEQAYGVRALEWRDRREGCDLYHLGALLAFVFTGVTPNSYYVRLPEAIRPAAWRGTWKGTYEEVVHHINAAFAEYLEAIKPDLPTWAAEELVSMISQMCDPDYIRRGHPDARNQVGSPIGLDRFVSRLDALAKEAIVKCKAA